MNNFLISFSSQHLEVLNILLGDAPYKVAAPVIAHIQKQIDAQLARVAGERAQAQKVASTPLDQLLVTVPEAPPAPHGPAYQADT